MAMLAEPRRKQKVINLRAKNNAWSNDSNKFGQRMLEKMGWSSGKGLGANENGIVDHVVAKFKNDDKGLGFEDRNDQWTKHEDDFNALLANLSNSDDKEQQSHSGISLEVKSKKSKARVHFHKFTRAKDLSRYSEKELANIFGKKSLKSKEKKEEFLKDDLKTTEQVFTEKGSMADYFKNKLLALGSKNKIPLPIYESNYDDEPDCGFHGFSGTTNDEAGHENASREFEFKSFNNLNADKDVENNKLVETNEKNHVDGAEETVECTKKSKKNKKFKKIHGSENIESSNNEDEMSTKIFSSSSTDNTPHEVLKEEGTKNKLKKSKLKRLLENESVSVEEEVEENVPKKKKKKKILLDDQEPVVIEDKNQNEDHVLKKKKKKKNKDILN